MKQIVFANVRQVTQKENALLVPLVPIGNDIEATHFLVTVIYDLMKHDVPFSELKKRYHVQNWTKEQVTDYIRTRGRCIKTQTSVQKNGQWKTEITFEGV